MNVHIHDFLPESETVLWDLWYPEAGATGVPIARGRLNPTEVLWVHAAPPTLEVTVRADKTEPFLAGLIDICLDIENCRNRARNDTWGRPGAPAI